MNSNLLQLDLELKDGKGSGDTATFITNGEWELIGNDTWYTIYVVVHNPYVKGCEKLFFSISWYCLNQAEKCVLIPFDIMILPISSQTTERTEQQTTNNSSLNDFDCSNRARPLWYESQNQSFIQTKVVWYIGGVSSGLKKRPSFCHYALKPCNSVMLQVGKNFVIDQM